MRTELRLYKWLFRNSVQVANGIAIKGAILIDFLMML